MTRSDPWSKPTADWHELEAQTATRVKEQIEQSVGSLLVSGRATVSEYDFGDRTPTTFGIEPENEAAAGFAVWVDGDELGVSVGHGSLELWNVKGQDPVAVFAELLDAVGEGIPLGSVTYEPW